MNLTASAVQIHCFYIQATTCSEIDFFVSMSPQQPISWMASTGVSGSGARLAPPFNGDGELKCVTRPSGTDLASHNALQGRALLSQTDGKTIGYAAIAFRRLVPGSFTGTVLLDGFTYEACPDRLHFNALTQQSGISDSELILVPCTEDLESGTVSKTTVQYAVVNELEQVFSGSTQLTCMDRRRFSTVPALRKSSIGTNTMHLIVRGVDEPVVGLVIDRIFNGGVESVSSNDPYLEGSRAATVNFPNDF